MSKFEVGKTYGWADSGYDPIRVLNRTSKTITVTNGTATWRMLLRVNEVGDEYVIDSSVPVSYRGLFTCNSRWEEE